MIPQTRPGRTDFWSVFARRIEAADTARAAEEHKRQERERAERLRWMQRAVVRLLEPSYRDHGSSVVGWTDLQVTQWLERHGIEFEPTDTGFPVAGGQGVTIRAQPTAGTTIALRAALTCAACSQIVEEVGSLPAHIEGAVRRHLRDCQGGAR